MSTLDSPTEKQVQPPKPINTKANKEMCQDTTEQRQFDLKQT